MKIKQVILIVLLIFSLVPLYIFSSFLIDENDKMIERMARENLAAISGSQILDITTFCQTREEKLNVISQFALVQDAVLASLENTEPTSDKGGYLKNTLKSWCDNSEFVESISIISRDFTVVSSSEPFVTNGKSAFCISDEKFRSGDFYISDVLQRLDDGEMKKVVIACVGIYDDKRELIGYVVEELSLNFFDKNRTNTNLWRNGTLYLMDSKNNLITAGRADEENRDIFVTSPEERSAYTKVWNSIDTEKNPSGEIAYNIDGIDYITYYSGIDHTDWELRLTIDMSVYESGRHAYRVLIAFSVVIITLLIVVSSLFISRRLTNSIGNIANTLKRVQDEQNYSLRVVNFANDELGELAQKVNRLLEYIERENLHEKEIQRQLALTAELDPLTGVKNKIAIERHLLDVVNHARKDERIAVAFVDIDDFKDYNTKYGHLEGDLVLQFVASVLEKYCGGTVGRNGGDEFLYIVDSVTDINELRQKADKILKRLSQGYFSREAGGSVPVPCSIGVVVAGGEKMSFGEILSNADRAMYYVKHHGKNGLSLIELDKEDNSNIIEKAD